MNKKEPAIMISFNRIGASVKRVKKPSINPAIIKMGKTPINSFNPILAEIWKDCNRE